MGNGGSRKAVDTGTVDFSVQIREFRIRNFNNYSQFNSGFQGRLGLNVWNEFRQIVEQAVQTYTQDETLSNWKGTYKCLSTIPAILAGISGFSAIYSFYALILGLTLDAKGVWVSAVVLICLICVWGLIAFLVRTKSLNLKGAYHQEIDNRVRSALQQLNNRYHQQCNFMLERIAGNKSVDFDFGCNLRMFFKITLFTQQINQVVVVQGGQPQQPQNVMVQMPNGQMVMAQVVQQQQQQQIVYQQPQQYVPPQSIVQVQPSAPAGPQYAAPPPVYVSNGAQEGGGQQPGGEGGNGNAQHTMQ